MVVQHFQTIDQALKKSAPKYFESAITFYLDLEYYLIHTQLKYDSYINKENDVIVRIYYRKLRLCISYYMYGGGLVEVDYSGTKTRSIVGCKYIIPGIEQLVALSNGHD